MEAREKHPVECVVEKMDLAFERGDLEALLGFYGDCAAAVLDPSGQLARGKAELRAAFQSVLQANGKITQQKTHVVEAAGIALFISYWNCTGTNPEGEPFDWQFTATTVFRREADGNWRVLIDNPFGPAVLEPQ